MPLIEEDDLFLLYGTIDKSKLDMRYEPTVVFIRTAEKARGTPQEELYFSKYIDENGAERNTYDERIKQIGELKHLIEEEHRLFRIGMAGNFTPPRAREFLAYYYNAMTPEDRYYATLDTYTTDGYCFPKRLIIGLKKIKPADYLKELPPEYADKDELTVYRASLNEAGRGVQTELSWTIKKEVAEHFQQMNTTKGLSSCIYKGIIRQKDIIAFSNCREEFEVIQHNSVKDIERI